MKVAREVYLALHLVATIMSLGTLLQQALADSKPAAQLTEDNAKKPAVQLTVTNAQPREMEDITENAIRRDYTAAWQGLSTALANNTLQPLNDNFSGFALDKLTQRVKDQKQNGLSTRIIDRGHKVDAIFYSPDGSAVELKDTASIETQVLDGGKVIHSDQAQIHYYAVMTGAEDRWKVRVLESAADLAQ